MRMGNGNGSDDGELTLVERQAAMLAVAEKAANDAVRTTEAAQKLLDRLPKIVEDTVGPAATAGARAAVWQEAHEALTELQGTVDRLGGTIARLDRTATQVQILAPRMAMHWLIAGLVLSAVTIVASGWAAGHYTTASLQQFYSRAR